MSTHRHIDRICAAAAVLALLLCILFMNGAAWGLQTPSVTLGYEARLFDSSRVHSIDIQMDDWDSFIQSAQSEEYTLCDLVIDGETLSGVGIRGKGNTSLSSVSGMNSQRYSFKLELDHYNSGISYYGLDKLCLNNLIQDNTCMKDYLVYQMMAQFGVDAPLCSYVYVTVNGEAWGLYLAVEAVEESFLQRNYGSGYGELYKPDSLSMGGGRGNGKDFDLSDFSDLSDRFNFSGGGAMPAVGGGMSLGMGSSDVKLQYIDDDPDSYANIFDNAKTNVTSADQNRLIASLKQLSSYENLDEVVDVDEVLRYFVVHNYVVNGDSYTGSMIHNYYLYEQDSQLSMIPWDYNLAFGTFQGGSASSTVNDDIDEVLSDRPMQAWIFSDETYTQQYYQLYAQLLEQVDIQGIIDSAYTLIAPYVAQDPTAFCSYEDFRTGVETLKEFCTLRSESVALQLSGSTETVDTGSLSLSAMGTMNNGAGAQQPGGMELPDGAQQPGNMELPDGAQQPGGMELPDGAQQPGGMELPDGAQQPGGMEFPDGVQQPGGFGGGMDGSDNAGAQPSGGQGSQATLLLLAVSVIVLLIGLLVAFLFRR